MTRQEIIEALISNKIPFGLMPEEMQEMMQEATEENCETFNGPKGWCDINSGTIFHPCYTYHLRSDYEDKPALVQCEIKENGGWLEFNTSNRWWALDWACRFPGFSGYLFEGGEVRMDSPIAWRHKDDTVLYTVTSLEELESVTAIIVNATNVLYRCQP